MQGAFIFRLLTVFYHIQQDFYTAFLAQSAGAKANIIVLSLAPGTTGVVLVVDLAALILFMQTGLGALLGFAVKTNDAVSTVVHIRIDKCMQAIITILQNVISVSAYNDTGAFICQLQNHTALNAPQEIGGRQTVHNTGNTLGSKHIGKKALAGGMLTVFFDKLGSETGFQCNLVNQFFIIEGDTQLFSQLSADGTAAAAEFTAYGNNLLFHGNALLEVINLIYYTKGLWKCQIQCSLRFFEESGQKQAGAGVGAHSAANIVYRNLVVSPGGAWRIQKGSKNSGIIACVS